MRKRTGKTIKTGNPWFIVFALLQKDLSSQKILIEKALDDESEEFSRIRCPLCKWHPAKSSRWHCVSGGFPEFYRHGCGAIWNTFETHGKCPGCSHQWIWTTCLSCHQNSLHEDWYSDR